MTEVPMPEVDPTVLAWLAEFLQSHGGVAGSVHRRRSDVLELAAAVNIPPKVVAVTATIPRGRGMAGLAWERGRPVTTCNLLEDSTGDVRPGAKAVDARAAAALPVHGEHGGDGDVDAVVGIAWSDDRNLDELALAALMKAAAQLPR